MLFPTVGFLSFFIAVAGLLVLVGRRAQLRKLVLVAASYVFYAQWDWHCCFLLAGSSVMTFVAGRFLAASGSPRARRMIAAIAIGLHLAVLGVFKYYDFFVGSLNGFVHRLGLSHELPFIEIALPVGVSFFTFHGISYVVDVYRGEVAVCRRLTDMLLYLSFFPQLVAGPIVRAASFLPQIYHPARARIDIGPPLMLILGGLFKKTVLATYLATDLVDPVFFDPVHFPAADLLLAAYGYAVQIYCDFSGYSDMAIGLAALLGYRFPVNFNQPYRAASLREFWQRWHISLSSWLRDYLYKPLGGSRGGRLLTARNLLLTMLLGGIWHGAAWKFVAWGGLHGVGLIIERAIAGRVGRWAETRAARVLATLLVFHIVCAGWVLFRADDIASARVFLTTLAQLRPGIEQATPFTLALLGLGLALHFLPAGWPQRLGLAVTRWPEWALGAASGACVAAIDAVGPDGVAPFIYFQF